MILETDLDPNAPFEYGFSQRRSRVDPAKTLGLIKRIQSASGAAPAPRPQPIQMTKTIVHAG